MLKINKKDPVFNVKNLEIKNHTLKIPCFVNLGRRSYPKAHEPVGRHCHDGELEICYLASGKQVLAKKGKQYILHGNDVFIAQPGEEHDSAGHPSEKCTLYWLTFKVDDVTDRFINCEGGEMRDLIASLKGIQKCYFQGHYNLKESLDKIIYANYYKVPFYKTIISNQLMAFLLTVLDLSEQKQEKAVSLKIDQVIRNIRENSRSNIRISELAGSAGLSVVRFSSLFKQETGIPPGEYILRAKVEDAKKKLSDPAWNITRIARAYGFSSSQYFATVFKRFTGQKPTEFKKALKK